jgi:hypothetical protein
MLTTDTQCDGNGACAGGPMVSACPSGYLCSGVACATSCGAAGTNCQSGFYCDGVGAGTCQALLASGAACNANYQCQSMHCNGANQCQ